MRVNTPRNNFIRSRLLETLFREYGDLAQIIDRPKFLRAEPRLVIKGTIERDIVVGMTEELMKSLTLPLP
jgi:hypothetical protein